MDGTSLFCVVCHRVVLLWVPAGKGACWLGLARLLSSGLCGPPRGERVIVSFQRALSEGKISTACYGTGNWGVVGELEACSTTEIGQGKFM